MAWIVYNSSTSVVVSGHPTQALANAAVTALGAGYTAERVNETSGGDEAPLPSTFVPNGYVRVGGGVIAALGEISETDILRRIAAEHRGLIEFLRQTLEELGHSYPQEQVNWAHDFLAFGEWGVRAVLLSSSLTFVEKVGWASASVSGPTDLNLNRPETFFSAVKDWTDTQVTARVPTTRILFAAPQNPHTNWALTNANTNTQNSDVADVLEDDPTTDQDLEDISTGYWINDI